MLTAPLLLFLAAFGACSPVALTARDSAKDYTAPLEGMDVDEAFPNEYVVVFQPGHTLKKHHETIGRDLSGSPRFKAFSYGYRSKLDDKTRDEQVRRDPGVRLVETNRPVHLIDAVNSTGSASPDSLHSHTGHGKREYTEVNSQDSPHGLQMITTAKKRLPIPVKDGGVYDYLFGAGQGTQVYIMDTGIRTTHRLFGGRARNFGGLSSTDISPYVDEAMQDTDGHGTHVAGTVGAEKYGVAPDASLINVKVLGDKKGDVAHVAQAIADIIKEHNENKQRHDTGFWTFRGSVINMSLSWQNQAFGILWQLIDANEAGISVYAAAGNDNKDSTLVTYPCANIQTECIAAVDSSYNKATFSNYGDAVNYIAPGVEIVSLGIKSDTDLAIKSGTSMASPHAAGAAAIFTSWRGLTTKLDLSQSFIYWNSISGVVSGFTGTTDLFVTTGIHSPKKYEREPFRWAGDYPVRNGFAALKNNVAPVRVAVASNQTIPKIPPTVPLSDRATWLYTSMETTTFGPISGFTTQSGDISGSAANPTVSVIATYSSPSGSSNPIVKTFSVTASASTSAAPSTSAPATTSSTTAPPPTSSTTPAIPSSVGFSSVFFSSSAFFF